jgi:adenylate cyclase
LSGQPEPKLVRRLATVMALDVAGYSRLMNTDEEGTYRRAATLMREVVFPSIASHGGRIVKRTGDGCLAEFQSVIGATEAALDIQRELRRRESGGPEERRLAFRIGINLGDVIVASDDIYGDGVNIAARLEAVAPPGGICVSRSVVDFVGRRAIEFIDWGELQLKNIGQKVHAFGIALEAGERPAPTIRDPHDGTAALPGFDRRPAIAVLPFDNYGADPDQEYFADGVTEDLITELAAWRIFPVIARNSVFTYKHRPVDIRTAGRELGARYVLEGSIQRRGARVRATAQLIEVETGHHLFADKFDRAIDDLLDLQDELVHTIAGALAPELLRAERQRFGASVLIATGAYDLLQRGLWHHNRFTREDNLLARERFRNALAVDPDYAHAAASLAVTVIYAVVNGWEADPASAVGEALKMAQRAVALDARDPKARFALGLAEYHSGSLHAAIDELREAIRLNPSYAVAHYNLGAVSNYLNRAADAQASITLALRLSPNDPSTFIWLPGLAAAKYLLGDYEEALAVARRGLLLRPDYLPGLRYAAAALGQLGRVEEAADEIARLHTLDRDLSATIAVLKRYYIDRSAFDHIIDGLRKAGFT